MDTKSSRPKVGDVIEREDGRHEVLAVWPKLTPFKKSGQTTKIEGWCLGTRRLS